MSQKSKFLASRNPGFGFLIFWLQNRKIGKEIKNATDGKRGKEKAEKGAARQRASKMEK